MSSDSPNIDYAELSDIHSVAAAVLFAVLYAPLAVLYLRQSFRNPTYVLRVLSLFCVIRMAAFTIRAVLAGSHSAGHNIHLFIAEEILYSVGFFGILYSTYTLVLDREIARGYNIQHPLAKITSNRRIFRLGLSAAAIMDIISPTEESSGILTNKGKNLRIASIAIFVAMTILLAVRTLILVKEELAYKATDDTKNRLFGDNNGSHILCAIVTLLVIRQIFYLATIADQSKQENEKLFYPFSVLTEFIAATLFSIPGLVPPETDLPKASPDKWEFLPLGLVRKFISS